MQVVTILVMLNCSIKVKRQLIARLLHRKRKVTLQTHLPPQWIGSLLSRHHRKRSAKVSPSLALLYKHRDVCCLPLCLIIHRPVIRPSKRETVVRRCYRSRCWRWPSQGSIDNFAQGCLVLSRNPIPCTGRQIQKAPCRIPKNILDGSILRRIQANARDMETECFTMGVNDQHIVADVKVAQTPKHCRVSTRTIQVSSNNRAALLAWTRTCIVPADIVPGTLPRRFHRAISSNSYRLDRGVDT